MAEHERNEDQLREVLGGFGGLWRHPDLLDYFFLVNPYFPTDSFIELFKEKLDVLMTHYPSNRRVDSALAAAFFGVREDSIVIGNGTSEIIKAVMEHEDGRIGVIRPTFEEYPNRYDPERTVVLRVNSPDYSYDETDVIRFFDDKEIRSLVLINCDNPSGNYIRKEGLFKLISWAKNRGIRLYVDESFSDFAQEEDNELIDQKILDLFPNLFVIKSISKSYGVAGIRLGIGACSDQEYMNWLKKNLSIWNINSLGEYFFQVIGDYRQDYQAALKRFRAERAWFSKKLENIGGLFVAPSQANYLMVRLDGGFTAAELQKKLFIDHSILIKDVSSKVTDGKQWMRLAVRNRKDNEVFIRKLEQTLAELRT